MTMGTVDFTPLISLLSDFSESIAIESSRFVVVAGGCKKEELEEALVCAGYNDKVHVKKEGLVFSLTADKWEELPPIYQDERFFWSRNESTGVIPDCYFIVSLGLSSQDETHSDFLETVRLVFKARWFLKEISDHYIPSDNKALFFVSHEGGGVKKSIPLSLGYDEVCSLSISHEGQLAAREISNTIYIDDVHHAERKEVLRRAVTSLLDESHVGDSEFVWLLKNIHRLHAKYKEQYEIYVHNFSVSKLLNEIDQKSLDFNSKLMDFVANSQNKALTIPGAIVAIAALVKSDGEWTIFLIMAGVLAVTYIVIMSNKMMDKTLDDLKWQIDKSFEKYGVIRDSEEVASLARESSQRLYDRIDKAKCNLLKINVIARCTFWIGLVYAVAVFLSSSFGFLDDNGKQPEKASAVVILNFDRSLS